MNSYPNPSASGPQGKWTVPSLSVVLDFVRVVCGLRSSDQMYSPPRSAARAEGPSSNPLEVATRHKVDERDWDEQVICGGSGQPRSPNNTLEAGGERSLEKEIHIDDAEPLNLRGDFYDIYLGTHITEGRVIVKRLRLRGGGESDDEALTRSFKREVDIWMSLPHDHILKCLGTFELKGNLCFVSPFMKNGTLSEWIRSKRPVGSERLRVIHELAKALGYLHTNGIVHGDVKAQKVLLSDDLRIQLCEFGLTEVAETRSNTRLKGAGSFRWQSPEIWCNQPKTSKSDTYAFSMTIVEILTGEVPFVELAHDCAVMMAVVGRNERPARVPATSPEGTSYAIAWHVAEQGWVADPNKRGSMTAAIGLLQGSSIAPNTSF